MAESATEKTSASMMMMPDWTKLPEELYQVIFSEKLNNCFDVVHARSVCTLWRSTIPFPCSLLRPSYSLPSFTEFPNESKGLCTLKKIPLFLFRVRTIAASMSASEYFLGGIGRRDESEDHIELPPRLQCSVKIPGSSDPTLMNMLDCQILPLGHQYRMIGPRPKDYRRVVFIPLNKEGARGGEFVVILHFSHVLLVSTSCAEMKWKRLENVPKEGACWDLVTFRGKFYASFLNRTTVVIDPCSLDVTLLMPSLHQALFNYLVPSGDDELFLVEKIVSWTRTTSASKCRVSRLDEEAGKWVVVTDLGDHRVLFINELSLGNVCCSAKELPDGCGVTGNSILFTDNPYKVTSYKYGVDTGCDEDDLSFWRLSRENPVINLSKSPVVALRVES